MWASTLRNPNFRVPPVFIFFKLTFSAVQRAGQSAGAPGQGPVDVSTQFLLGGRLSGSSVLPETPSLRRPLTWLRDGLCLRLWGFKHKLFHLTVTEGGTRYSAVGDFCLKMAQNFFSRKTFITLTTRAKQDVVTMVRSVHLDCGVSVFWPWFPHCQFFRLGQEFLFQSLRCKVAGVFKSWVTFQDDLV